MSDVKHSRVSKNYGVLHVQDNLHVWEPQLIQILGYNITEAISSNIDDVTMHELYLWPFADAVKAGLGSIMCSYNQVNNSYACQNSKLLNNLLKNELGFQGILKFFNI
jgi:hypothetical protein